MVEKFEEDGKLLKNVKKDFLIITDYIKDLDINYEEYKIQGVSHLYGLWGFSINCIKSDTLIDNVKSNLDEFFNKLRFKNGNINDEKVELNRNSMSYGTKSKGQRNKRIAALCDYCNVSNKNR